MITQINAQVMLPKIMTGKAIMKLTKPRLTPLCDGQDVVAAELFTSLRVAAKEADKYAREQRARMKEAASVGGAVGFARGTPAKPQIVAAAALSSS